MTNYEHYPSQERPVYYQPQQYMPSPPVIKPGKGLAVAAFVCSLVEFALVLIAIMFAAASLSGMAGFFLFLAFLLLVVTPILLLVFIAKK